MKNFYLLIGVLVLFSCSQSLEERKKIVQNSIVELLDNKEEKDSLLIAKKIKNISNEVEDIKDESLSLEWVRTQAGFYSDFNTKLNFLESELSHVNKNFHLVKAFLY